jgi:hypothetical protein
MDGDSQQRSRKSEERAARRERLAKALRDNLRRRKEQARAREELRAPRPKKPGSGGGLSGASLSSTSTPGGSKTAN